MACGKCGREYRYGDIVRSDGDRYTWFLIEPNDDRWWAVCMSKHYDLTVDGVPSRVGVVDLNMDSVYHLVEGDAR